MKVPQYHNYDCFPEYSVAGKTAFEGAQAIAQVLKNEITGDKVIVFDCYPGVEKRTISSIFAQLAPAGVFYAEDCMLDKEAYAKKVKPYLTDDRVFGYLCQDHWEKYFDPQRIEQMQRRLRQTDGLRIVYGVGAALITTGDILICCDMARWEIQCRYRRGLANVHTDNSDAPQLSKYKQGYFLDWRLADRHKTGLVWKRMKYVLDANDAECPKMLDAESFFEVLDQLAHRPFRLVPYFDPGVWGGQWMKEVCALPEAPNYAWSFDGVPEENSLYVNIGGVRMEFPAMDLTLYRPKELLGERVYERFGAEFPIRFDFLDTMGGQNLSLQVHPLTEYIQRNFGMSYTQDESYYLLDTDEDEETYVYLGIKTGVDQDAMLRDLYRAQKGEILFPAEQYVNRIPVKKHDHILIPAGTIHCSGKNTMVLEISATPYIFTFKLWDWGRLGLDGLPRPIHIEHGKKVIQWNRDTAWVKENLVDRFETLCADEHKVVERTGLHELEFIDTVRRRSKEKLVYQNDGSVNMLNLVSGRSAVVESPSGAFEPFIVHYAETFILPASVETYTIAPYDCDEIMTVCALVRK